MLSTGACQSGKGLYPCLSDAVAAQASAVRDGRALRRPTCAACHDRAPTGSLGSSSVPCEVCGPLYELACAACIVFACCRGSPIDCTASCTLTVLLILAPLGGLHCTYAHTQLELSTRSVRRGRSNARPPCENQVECSLVLMERRWSSLARVGRGGEMRQRQSSYPCRARLSLLRACVLAPRTLSIRGRSRLAPGIPRACDRRIRSRACFGEQT